MCNYTYFMNKEFCINCGAKNLYEVVKPKFCIGCGSPFNTSVRATSRREEGLELDDDDHAPANFNLKKLRASIVAESNKSKQTLDDLWKDPAPKDPNFYRAPSNDPSGTEILKQTMTECSQVKVAKEVGEAGE
jgi:hypothetical protein